LPPFSNQQEKVAHEVFCGDLEQWNHKAAQLIKSTLCN